MQTETQKKEEEKKASEIIQCFTLPLYRGDFLNLLQGWMEFESSSTIQIHYDIYNNSHLELYDNQDENWDMKRKKRSLRNNLLSVLFS